MPVAMCTSCGLIVEGTADGGPDDYDLKTAGHFTRGCPRPRPRAGPMAVPHPYRTPPTLWERSFYARNNYWPTRDPQATHNRHGDH